MERAWGVQGMVLARLPGAELGESSPGLQAEGLVGFHRPSGPGAGKDCRG